MRTPLQVAFNGLYHFDALEEKIRDSVEKLEQYSNEIVDCCVMVDQRHHSHLKGNLFHVQVELSFPKRQLVVNREPRERHAHEDVLVALRDASRGGAEGLSATIRRRSTVSSACFRTRNPASSPPPTATRSTSTETAWSGDPSARSTWVARPATPNRQCTRGRKRAPSSRSASSTSSRRRRPRSRERRVAGMRRRSHPVPPQGQERLDAARYG